MLLRLANRLIGSDGTNYIFGLASLAAVAGFGILTNLGIAYLFDATTLGLFGLAIAVYIICTQLAIFGIQNSTLHFSATESLDELGKIVGSALVVVTVISSAVLTVAGILLIALRELIPEARFTVVLIAICSSPVGAILKTLLSSLNGINRLGQFYFLQVLRVALVAVWVVIVHIAEFAGIWVTASFIFAETLTALIAAYFFVLVNKIKPAIDADWAVKHFKFGSRAFTSGLSSETHTRADLIVLSFFVDDTKLGIYTFVSMLWDGLYQYIAIVRTITNPQIAKLYATNQIKKLASVLNRAKLTAFVGYVTGTIVILALYPVFISFLSLDPVLHEGWPVLVILLIITAGASWLLPFDQALSQCGAPGTNSVTLASGAVTNLILNLLLTPSFGMLGAAIATGLSWVVLSIYLVNACNRVIGLKLLSWRS